MKNEIDIDSEIRSLIQTAHSILCQAHRWEILAHGITPTVDVLDRATDIIYGHLTATAVQSPEAAAVAGR